MLRALPIILLLVYSAVGCRSAAPHGPEDGQNTRNTLDKSTLTRY